MPSAHEAELAGLICQLQLIDAARHDELLHRLDDAPARTSLDIALEQGWLSPADCQALRHIFSRRQAALADSVPDDSHGTIDTHAQGRPDEPPHDDRTILSETATGQNDPRLGDVELPPAVTRYTFRSLQARGGMGLIWRAWDEQFHREVAVKELRRDLPQSAAIFNRFLREARLTAQLQHPGIVAVHELGRNPQTGAPFYSMRFMSGRTLKQAIAGFHAGLAQQPSGDFELVNLLAAFIVVCQTVAYAHSQGIIHRDLKSDNVLLGDFGEVVVVDWGLAKAVGEADLPADAAPGWDSHPEDSGLTMHGEVLGTPAYMSPEQARGDLAIDHRTDVYGLGAILYELLTGQPPFTGKTVVEILTAVTNSSVVPPRQLRPEIPRVLEIICLKALEPDPQHRHATAAELAAALQHWQDSQRQAAEAELRASRERFALAVEGSQDGLWDWDLKTGEVYFSPRWKSLLGYLDHELSNNLDEWSTRLHPDERERVLAANYAHINGQTPFYEYEYRLRHKDGSYRWILARGVAQRNAQGEACRMAGSHVDVTQRRETEQQLRHLEQQYRSVLNLVPDALFLIDEAGQITGANQPARRLLALESEAPLPRLFETPLGTLLRSDGTLYPAEEHPLRLTAVTDTARAATRVGIRQPDGTTHWFQLSSLLIATASDSAARSLVACFAPTA